MIEFSSKQMNMISRLRRKEFDASVVRFLSEKLPESLVADDRSAFAYAVSREIDSAYGLGIKRRSYVVSYVMLAITYGPDFARRPPFQEIWSRPLDAESKVAACFHKIKQNDPETHIDLSEISPQRGT